MWWLRTTCWVRSRALRPTTRASSSLAYGRMLQACFTLLGKSRCLRRRRQKGGRAILELEHLRDACILLAQHRCYREFPQTWVHSSLENSGFEVVSAWRKEIVYGPGYIERQLKVCSNKLRFFKTAGLANAMAAHIEDLRARALVLVEIEGGIALGSDYVVVAKPA